MISHAIRFTLKSNAPKDQVEVAFEQLRKCGREIKAVQFFCVGRDFGRKSVTNIAGLLSNHLTA